nr:hypothetical protein SHINE37_110278 [Rhizobiaceae bacterium]
MVFAGLSRGAAGSLFRLAPDAGAHAGGGLCRNLQGLARCRPDRRHHRHNGAHAGDRRRRRPFDAARAGRGDGAPDSGRHFPHHQGRRPFALHRASRRRGRAAARLRQWLSVKNTTPADPFRRPSLEITRRQADLDAPRIADLIAEPSSRQPEKPAREHGMHALARRPAA